MRPDWNVDNPYLEEYLRSVLFGLGFLGLFLVTVGVLEALGRPVTRADLLLAVASVIVLTWVGLGIAGLYRLLRP